MQPWPGVCGSSPPVMVSSALPQFHKDMKDAQELLRKVDSDLNQKYSPDFKDRYQIELLLRELDVSWRRVRYPARPPWP